MPSRVSRIGIGRGAKSSGYCFRNDTHIGTKVRQWAVDSVGCVQKGKALNEGFLVGGANTPPLDF